MHRMINATMRLGARVFATAVILALVAGNAAAKPGKPGKPGPNSPFNLHSGTTTLLNVNQWTCGLDNLGEICVNPLGSSVGGGGWWPQGTNNQYIFNTGLQLGAIIGSDGGAWAGDTIADHFFDAYGAYNSGVPKTNIFSSDDPNDVANWPQECYLTNPATGEQVKTLSQLDACVTYWDADPQKGFADGHPMGIQVTQHSLAWSYATNRDIIFFIFRFTNVTNDPAFKAAVPAAPAGGFTLTNMYAAFGADPDVSSSDASHNFGTVVPDQNMAVAWNADFSAPDFVPYAPNFDAAPGFFGVKFLRGPTNTADTAIIRKIGIVTDTVKPGQPLGMTFFSLNTNGGEFPDPTQAHQAYRYVSGRLSAAEKQACSPIPGMCFVAPSADADVRFIMSSGPFTLKPGQSADIVVAYMAGAPVPGTYVKGTQTPIGSPADTLRQIEKVMGRGYKVAGFPSIFTAANNAQAIYNAGFILPGAPPGPNVTVIPGDHQNTILWDASPTTATDPYYDIASKATINGKPNALYDPKYKRQDFEGFRVYRKVDPAAAWTPIAQFDLPNGISEVVTPITKALNLNGDTIVIVADTASVCQKGTKEQLGLSSNWAGCEAETGLRFAVIDKGGSYPDPSNGPGLTNGRRYYYAVTSFDVNSPSSGPSSLESARVLSNTASGVPRSAPDVAASTATVQMVGGDNSVLDPTKTVTVDASTGAFSAPIPPTDGFKVTGDLVPEAVTSPQTTTVTIDSIVPGAPQAGVGHKYYISATGPGGKTSTALSMVNGFTTMSAVSAASGLDATKTKVVTSVQVEMPGAYALSNMQRAVVNGYSIGDNPVASTPSWPRWFVSGSGETADGAAGNQYSWCATNFGDPNIGYEEAEQTYCAAVGKPQAGAVAGYEIAPMISYSTLTSVSRGFDGVLGGAWRAADIEVTWGADGAVTSVQDLTHKVAVPFSPNLRASYGFMTPASFANVNAAQTADKNNNVITFSDYTCLDPVNTYAIGGMFDNSGSACKSPVPAQLQPKAALVQVNWPGPAWSTKAWSGTADQKTGFSMYINGQIYHFIGSSLPAAGTKWTLRTFTGYIAADAVSSNGETVDYQNYKFVPVVRPPAVPGLRAVITINPAEAHDLTAADLAKVHTVPDPYYITNTLENNQLQKKLLFVNLPPKAIIRIYTLSGTLVRALSHDDPSGGGQEEWDLRSRNSQYVASGVYFYHVEAPNGKTTVGKFTVIQYAQ